MIAQNNGQYLTMDKSAFALDEREDTTTKSANKRILAMETRRAEFQARIRDDLQDLTQIQIVMLGASWASRSSAGNLILGKESFEVGGPRTTVCCNVKNAALDEKLLTVVDTPGWYYNYPVEKTPEMDKLEIRRSVHLCAPGPNAILLTIPIAISYDRTVHTAVEEHMSLLGEKVWNHTIVLFTWGDCLGDTTIEERIEKEDKHLELLTEKCGNRYHVFNCKNHTDRTQVTELLEKIEEIMMENNNSHYVPEMESNPCLEIDLMLKTTRTNMKKVRRERAILQELLKERKKHFSELRIVLLGVEGVGKGTSGNIILQGQFFENRLGKDFKIMRISQCVMRQSKVGGCQISVVDTPGWSTSTRNARKDILNSVKVCSPGPHVFLLVLPVDEAFTEKTQQTVMELMGLFGARVWRHTLILFTEGHWLKDRPIEEYIVYEGKALQSLVERCENRYHVLVNDLGNKSQATKLFEMIEDTVARNRGEYFTLEKKRRDSTSQKYARSKTLTEETWKKHEDELIERMLEVAVADLDAESKQPFARRRGSFSYSIPSLSGEFQSTRADAQNPAVPQRLQPKKCQVPSSGYHSKSNTSHSEDQMTDDVKKDIPTHSRDLSGDSLSDNTSVSTADTQISGVRSLYLYAMYKLFYKSGHHNKSTSSSSQHPNVENIRKDIPTTKNQQTGMDSDM
ncbi:GTPase IMAP family member 8-like [Sinocyclocheilus anshuiensis]|uniref:GTPase IMAP family member 8-like n=1 Tax=Sinocyclocheilus anshuiensis TaxID=1608454 RepID=UPI0007B86F33|nr:PREDICTED: GTPase IMAP family member 8-like [Sinocyclocheilus anshuiensis]